VALDGTLTWPAPLEALPILLALAAYGWLYWRGVMRLRGTARAVPGWRVACFAAGLVLIAFGLLSPLAALADELFWAHMAEHLLIGDVGALLLVLGLTGPLLAPVLRLPGMGALRTLTHPVVAYLLWALNLYAWHLPVLHEAAVRDETLHAVQHLLFLGFGMNMWMALLGPLPKPAWFGNAAMLGYVVLVRLTPAVLGNVFLFSGGAFYDVYAPTEAAWGISPAADQVAAGGLMMVEGSLVTLGLFCWLFLRAARQSEERQELLDLARANGVELSERRAGRAVAAGRGDELRERISAADGRTASRAG
jgi:cytochrome c oxidase assembly factor CtaG